MQQFKSTQTLICSSSYYIPVLKRIIRLLTTPDKAKDREKKRKEKKKKCLWLKKRIFLVA